MPAISPVPKRTPSAELLQHDGSDKSSDYLNLAEPPAASKTPDPSNLFPLKRRSSSNYQTALLGDQLKNVNFNQLNTTHGKKPQVNTDPLTTTSSHSSIENQYNLKGLDEESAINNEEEYYPTTGDMSPEGSKRYFQRRSTGNGADESRNSFNVQYRGSVSYPPQSTTKETAPNSEKYGVPRSYHSNQQSPSHYEEHKNEYFPTSFEYADFKRRMSKD